MRWCSALALAAALASTASALADEPEADERGIYAYPRGQVGQIEALTHIQQRTEALQLTQMEAGAPGAELAAGAIQAVLDEPINRGGCEVLEPGFGNPHFDGFCSSDYALAVCVEDEDDPETFGRDNFCYGFINERPRRSEGVLEIMGVAINEAGDEAEIHAALVWANRREAVRSGFFQFDLAYDGKAWSVTGGSNIDTGQRIVRSRR